MGLLLIAVLSPLCIEVRFAAGDGLRYSLALRPFAGYGPRLTVSDSERPTKRKSQPKKERKRKKTKHGPSRSYDPRKIFHAVLQLMSEFAGKFHVEKIALDIRYGLEDPAETGQIFGALVPFIYGTHQSQQFNLNIEPVFDHIEFSGRAALDVSLTPARLIPPLVRIGWLVFGPRR
jgi:hypothetical protein